MDTLATELFYRILEFLTHEEIFLSLEPVSHHFKSVVSNYIPYKVLQYERKLSL